MRFKFPILYIVQSGTIKVSSINEDGLEQIFGFYLPGDVLGLDTVYGQLRVNSATALDTAMICQVPFPRLEGNLQEQTAVLSQIHRLVIDELYRNQLLRVLLCHSSGEEKVRWFLKDFSQRLSMMGLSSTRFRLPITRVELGSFLGLRLETVSRIFTNLRKEGYLSVAGKEIVLREKLLINLIEVKTVPTRKVESVGARSLCSA
jgi:CRP/FNR family transcriptional regulator